MSPRKTFQKPLLTVDSKNEAQPSFLAASAGAIKQGRSSGCFFTCGIVLGEVTSPHFSQSVGDDASRNSRTICEVPRPTKTSALPAQLQFSEVWPPAAAILVLEPAFLGFHLSWAYPPSPSLLLGPSATNSKYAIRRGTSQVV